MASEQKKPPVLFVGAGIGAGVGLAMVIGKDYSLVMRTLMGAGIGLGIGLVMVMIAQLLRKKG